MATVLTFWGGWFLLPGDTYVLSERIYSGLAGMASEEFWGFLSFGFGLVHMTALIVNGRFYLTPTIRAMSAGVGSTIWLVVLITSIVNGAVLALSTPLYGLFCLANWHILIMAGQDQRMALAANKERSDG
jgi:hypothetical protein